MLVPVEQAVCHGVPTARRTVESQTNTMFLLDFSDHFAGTKIVTY